MTEISIREKEKWTNKGTDKKEMADSLLHYTTYHTNACTKFHHTMSSSSREIFHRKKVYTHTHTHTHTQTSSQKIQKLYTPYILRICRGYKNIGGRKKSHRKKSHGNKVTEKKSQEKKSQEKKSQNKGLNEMHIICT